MRTQYLIISLGLASPILADITCGVSHGYDRGTNAYFFSGDGSLSDFDACSGECQSSSECQSFAFGDEQCLLYSSPLDTNFRPQDNSPFLFYDRDCMDVKASSSFMTALPTSATATAAQAAGTTPASADATATAATSSGNDQGGGGGGASGSSASSDEGESPTTGTASSEATGGTDAGAAASSASSASAAAAATGTSSAGAKTSGASASGSSTASRTSTSSSTASASLQSTGSASAAGPAMRPSAGWLAGSAVCCLFAMWA